MHQHTEEEGNGYGKENTHDDGQGFVRIDEVAEAQRVTAMHLDERQGECSAQQFEYHGYGGGCRHPHCVEYVQQHYVGQHDGQQDTHDFSKIEMLRLVDAMPGDVHHAVGQGSADKDADARYKQYGFERCCFGSDSRLKKVYCIIADTHDEVENREDEQEDDNA